MSVPVVWIGYILLVPSFIGMALTVLVTGVSMIGPFLSGAATKDSAAVAAGGFFAAFSAVSGACLFIAFFISGLLGWLLCMKKSVLRCNLCGMTIDAA